MESFDCEGMIVKGFISTKKLNELLKIEGRKNVLYLYIHNKINLNYYQINKVLKEAIYVKTK